MSALENLLNKHKKVQNEKKKSNFGNELLIPYHLLKPEDDKNNRLAIRFLYPKDGEDYNFSLVDNYHRLPTGTDATGKTTFTSFACNRNFGEKCPICEVASSYYIKDADNQPDMYKLFKSSKSMLYVGYIVKKVEALAEFKYTYGVLKAGWQLHTAIDKAIASDELAENLADFFEKNPDDATLPIGFGNNAIFMIRSDKKGKWNDYSRSSFEWKATNVIEPEDYEPIDLTKHTHKRLTSEEIDAVLEKVEAVLDNRPLAEGEANEIEEANRKTRSQEPSETVGKAATDNDTVDDEDMPAKEVINESRTERNQAKPALDPKLSRFFKK